MPENATTDAGSTTTQIVKESIDLGIVTADAGAALAFYRDTLGLRDLGDSPMPGGRMHRLGCGSSVIKIITTKRPTPAVAPPGGIQGATGYRYWTITVSNLEDVVRACGSAGRTIAVPPTEIQPGVQIAMIEDPDGNWVELLQQS